MCYQYEENGTQVTVFAKYNSTPRIKSLVSLSADYIQVATPVRLIEVFFALLCNSYSYVLALYKVASHRIRTTLLSKWPPVHICRQYGVLLCEVTLMSNDTERSAATEQLNLLGDRNPRSWIIRTRWHTSFDAFEELI